MRISHAGAPLRGAAGAEELKRDLKEAGEALLATKDRVSGAKVPGAGSSAGAAAAGHETRCRAVSSGEPENGAPGATVATST